MARPDKRAENTRRRLLDALGRLRDGRALSSDGKLTPSSLAKEAHVGRATVYRFPDLLDALLQLKAGAGKAKNLYERNRELEAEIRRLRSEDKAEVLRLRSLNGVYAQRIQLLTLALHTLQKEVAANEKVSPGIGAGMAGQNVVVAFCQQLDLGQSLTSNDMQGDRTSTSTSADI